MKILVDEKLPKELSKITETWLKKLELDKYDLKITVYEPTEIESDSTLGMVHFLDKNGNVLNEKRDSEFKTIWIEITLSNFKSKKLISLEQTILHELLHVKYPEHRFDNVWTENKVKELVGKDYIEPTKR